MDLRSNLFFSLFSLLSSVLFPLQFLNVHLACLCGHREDMASFSFSLFIWIMYVRLLFILLLFLSFR